MIIIDGMHIIDYSSVISERVTKNGQDILLSYIESMKFLEKVITRKSKIKYILKVI